MNILGKVLEGFKAKSKITKISAAVIAAAFVGGLALKLFVKEADHPIEQFLEAVLRTQGIDHDFSEDKKK